MPDSTLTPLNDLLQFMSQPAIIETFVDILLCIVPIWLAIMIGLLIGWSWKPRWSGLLFLGFRTKLRFLWTAPPGFGARRLWLAFTALSAFSVLKTLLSSFFGGTPKQPLVPVSHHSDHQYSPITGSDGAQEAEHDVVTEKDLEHLLHILDGKDGEISWQSMMEHTTSNMSYQAWHHEPENGPTIYRSQTVFEDATAELVRDFFWDDEFRPKWDRMLTYFKILDDCSHTGTMIVHWVKKFPFFCSDREYIIGRRIWEAGKAYYCITKGVPYPNLPKRDKPRRVERYFSSWMIKPVKSLKEDGSMTACEVCLVHYEDMGIPKDVAKLGVRHGMWDTVKKLHVSMRAYQNARKSEVSLSRCAIMASITTKVSFDGDLMPFGASGEEEQTQTLNSHARRKHGMDLKWVLIGGTVAVICGLQTGILKKALMIGARRKFFGS
ncbi:StAR-related lipid transfer protein 7 mitochondrial [Bienertia sinuspersici]